MNDNIKPVDFYVPQFNNKLEGHTKIVLTNPYRTQVIEHDNTIQSAIVAKQMRNMGYFNIKPTSYYLNDVWKRLFGGIFLFDSTIQVGTEYMPAGVTMTANGSVDVQNSAAPLTMGSYDNVKSSVGDGIITQVYNWSQAQGNGDISCVCLTSMNGGYIGYGNPDGAKKGSRNIYEYSEFSGYTNGSPILYHDNNVYTLVIDNSAKTVTVTRINKCTTKFELFDNLTSPTTTHNYTTALNGNIRNGWVSDGKGKFATAGCATIASGGTFQVLVYDTTTDTLTEHTITNNTGSTLTYTSSSSSSSCGLCGFDGTNIYMPLNRGVTDTTMYKIALSDSSVVDTIQHVNTSINYPAHVVQFTKNHVSMLNPSEQWCIYDSVNHTLYPMNIGSFIKNYASGSTMFGFCGYNETEDVMASASTFKYGSNNGVCMMLNPMYLATINNLQTTVSKTNEDSMSVTYILEEVSN